MTTKQLTRPKGDTVGVVYFAEAEIDFSSVAVKQVIASLPAGAVVISLDIEVVTAFNAGSTNLLTGGYGAIAAGTADDFCATVDETTPAIYVGTGIQPKLQAATDVAVYYTPTGTPPTTGVARAYLRFALTAQNAG